MAEPAKIIERIFFGSFAYDAICRGVTPTSLSASAAMRCISTGRSNRRMARDFERYAETAKAFIQIAMIKLMTRRLARFINS
jgi:hypothetical protein